MDCYIITQQKNRVDLQKNNKEMLISIITMYMYLCYAGHDS